MANLIGAQESYVNPYDAQYYKSVTNKNFNKSMWDKAFLIGEQDKYISLLEQSKDTDMSKEFYDPLYYDYERMMTELYAETSADRNNSIERVVTAYDALGNPYEVKQNMSDYDYLSYQLKQMKAAQSQQIQLAVDTSRKEAMNGWEKFGNSVAAFGAELGEGALSFLAVGVDIVAASGAATIESLAFGDNWFDAYADALTHGLTAAEQESIRASLDDYERRKTYFRTVEGEITTAGKYIAGVANAIGFMIPSMVLGAMTGGATFAGTSVANLVFYAGVFGKNVYDNATNPLTKNTPGYIKFGNALAQAVSEAVIERGLEGLLSRLGLGGASLQNRLMGVKGSAKGSTAALRNTTTNLQKLTSKKFVAGAYAKLLGTTMLQEGTEEFLQDAGDMIINDLTDIVVDDFLKINNEGKGYGDGLDFQTLTDSFITGALMSGVMSLSGVGLNRAASGIDNKWIKQHRIDPDYVSKFDDYVVVDVDGKKETVQLGGFGRAVYQQIVGGFYEQLEALKTANVNSTNLDSAKELLSTTQALGELFNTMDEARITNLTNMLNIISKRAKKGKYTKADEREVKNAIEGSAIIQSIVDPVKKQAEIDKAVKTWKKNRFSAFVENVKVEATTALKLGPAQIKTLNRVIEKVKEIATEQEKESLHDADTVVAAIDKDTKDYSANALDEETAKALSTKTKTIEALRAEYSNLYVTEGSDAVAIEDVAFVPLGWIENYDAAEIKQYLGQQRLYRTLSKKANTDIEFREFLNSITQIVRNLRGDQSYNPELCFYDFLFNPTVYQNYIFQDNGKNFTKHQKYVANVFTTVSLIMENASDKKMYQAIIDQMRKTMREPLMKAVLNWGANYQDVVASDILNAQDKQFIRAKLARKQVFYPKNLQKQSAHHLASTLVEQIKENSAFRESQRANFGRDPNNASNAATKAVANCVDLLTKYVNNEKLTAKEELTVSTLLRMVDSHNRYVDKSARKTLRALDIALNNDYSALQIFTASDFENAIDDNRLDTLENAMYGAADYMTEEEEMFLYSYTRRLRNLANKYKNGYYGLQDEKFKVSLARTDYYEVVNEYADRAKIIFGKAEIAYAAAHKDMNEYSFVVPAAVLDGYTVEDRVKLQYAVETFEKTYGDLNSFIADVPSLSATMTIDSLFAEMHEYGSRNFCEFAIMKMNTLLFDNYGKQQYFIEPTVEYQSKPDYGHGIFLHEYKNGKYNRNIELPDKRKFISLAMPFYNSLAKASVISSPEATENLKELCRWLNYYLLDKDNKDTKANALRSRYSTYKAMSTLDTPAKYLNLLRDGLDYLLHEDYDAYYNSYDFFGYDTITIDKLSDKIQEYVSTHKDEYKDGRRYGRGIDKYGITDVNNIVLNYIEDNCVYYNTSTQSLAVLFKTDFYVIDIIHLREGTDSHERDFSDILTAVQDGFRNINNSKYTFGKYEYDADTYFLIDSMTGELVIDVSKYDSKDEKFVPILLSDDTRKKDVANYCDARINNNISYDARTNLSKTILQNYTLKASDVFKTDKYESRNVSSLDDLIYMKLAKNCVYCDENTKNVFTMIGDGLYEIDMMFTPPTIDSGLKNFSDLLNTFYDGTHDTNDFSIAGIEGGYSVIDTNTGAPLFRLVRVDKKLDKLTPIFIGDDTGKSVLSKYYIFGRTDDSTDEFKNARDTLITNYAINNVDILKNGRHDKLTYSNWSLNLNTASLSFETGHQRYGAYYSPITNDIVVAQPDVDGITGLLVHEFNHLLQTATGITQGYNMDSVSDKERRYVYNNFKDCIYFYLAYKNGDVPNGDMVNSVENAASLYKIDSQLYRAANMVYYSSVGGEVLAESGKNIDRNILHITGKEYAHSIENHGLEGQLAGTTTEYAENVSLSLEDPDASAPEASGIASNLKVSQKSNAVANGQKVVTKELQKATPPQDKPANWDKMSPAQRAAWSTKQYMQAKEAKENVKEIKQADAQIKEIEAQDKIIADETLETNKQAVKDSVPNTKTTEPTKTSESSKQENEHLQKFEDKLTEEQNKRIEAVITEAVLNSNTKDIVNDTVKKITKITTEKKPRDLSKMRLEEYARTGYEVGGSTIAAMRNAFKYNAQSREGYDHTAGARDTYHVNLTVKSRAEVLKPILNSKLDAVDKSTLTLNDVIMNPDKYLSDNAKKALGTQINSEGAVYTYLKHLLEQTYDNVSIDRDNLTHEYILVDDSAFNDLLLTNVRNSALDAGNILVQKLTGKGEFYLSDVYFSNQLSLLGIPGDKIRVVVQSNVDTRFEINKNNPSGIIYIKHEKNMNDAKLVSTINHEFRHVLQAYSGFEGGFTMNFNVTDSLLEDVKTHVPEIFEDAIIRKIAKAQILPKDRESKEMQDRQIVKLFVYGSVSGEINASGIDTNLLGIKPTYVTTDVTTNKVSLFLPWYNADKKDGHHVLEDKNLVAQALDEYDTTETEDEKWQSLYDATSWDDVLKLIVSYDLETKKDKLPGETVEEKIKRRTRFYTRMSEGKNEKYSSEEGAKFIQRRWTLIMKLHMAEEQKKALEKEKLKKDKMAQQIKRTDAKREKERKELEQDRAARGDFGTMKRPLPGMFHLQSINEEVFKKLYPDGTRIPRAVENAFSADLGVNDKRYYTGKTRGLLDDKIVEYKDTNMKYFLKEGAADTRRQLDPALQAFIVSTTGHENEIDELVMNAIKSGKLNKDALLQYVNSTEEMSDTTFYLINKYIFGNPEINSLKELDTILQDKLKLYWALSLVFANYKIDESIFSMEDSLTVLEEWFNKPENKKIKDEWWNKAVQYTKIYFDNVDVNQDKFVDVTDTAISPSLKEYRTIVLRRFDGSIANAYWTAVAIRENMAYDYRQWLKNSFAGSLDQRLQGKEGETDATVGDLIGEEDSGFDNALSYGDEDDDTSKARESGALQEQYADDLLSLARITLAPETNSMSVADMKAYLIQQDIIAEGLGDITINPSNREKVLNIIGRLNDRYSAMSDTKLKEAYTLAVAREETNGARKIDNSVSKVIDENRWSRIRANIKRYETQFNSYVTQKYFNPKTIDKEKYGDILDMFSYETVKKDVPHAGERNTTRQQKEYVLKPNVYEVGRGRQKGESLDISKEWYGRDTTQIRDQIDKLAQFLKDMRIKHKEDKLLAETNAKLVTKQARELEKVNKENEILKQANNELNERIKTMRKQGKAKGVRETTVTLSNDADDKKKPLKKSHTRKETSNAAVRSDKLVLDTPADVIIPEKLLEIYATSFSAREANEVQFISRDEEGNLFSKTSKEYESARDHEVINFSKFFELNNEILSTLDREDVLNIVAAIHLNTNNAPTVKGDVYADRKVKSYTILTLGYIIAAIRRTPRRWNLSNKDVEIIERIYEDMAGTAGLVLRSVGEMTKMIDPYKMVITQRMVEYGITEEDTLPIHNGVIAYYDAENAEEQKKAAQELNSQLDILAHKLHKKKTFAEKFLGYTFIAKLSSPITAAKNTISNELIKVTDKMAESIANIIFARKDIAQDQYDIANMKVSDDVRKYVTQNFLTPGALFYGAYEGQSKYNPTSKQNHIRSVIVDPITGKKKTVVQDDLVKVLVEGITQKYDDSRRNFAEKIVMKFVSDEKFIKYATHRYFERMLQQDVNDGKIDISSGTVNEQVVRVYFEALRLASEDYMHKPAIFNELLGELKRKHPAVAYAVQLFEPFLNTSWNFFVSGLKFNPLSLAVSIRRLVKLNAEIEKVQNARDKGQIVHTDRVVQYLLRRDIGKGILGTITMTFAAFLSMIGFVRIDEDDKEKIIMADTFKVDLSYLYGMNPFTLTVATISELKTDDNWVDKAANILGDAINIIATNFFAKDIFDRYTYDSAFNEAVFTVTDNFFSSLIPQVYKLFVALSKNYKVKYKSDFLRLIDQAIPFTTIGNIAIDPYTGEEVSKYAIPIVGDLTKRLFGVEFINISDEQKLAESFGASKQTLSGTYKTTVFKNGEYVDTTITLDYTTLNKKYGQLNKASLATIEKEKHRVKMPDGTYKYLTWNAMSDKQKKSAIDSAFSKNAEIAKIYAWTCAGHKYYASNDLYTRLKAAGVSGVYSGGKGFVE